MAERLKAALPKTRVVKTLNTMLAPVMSNPGLLAASATVFLSGDDPDAKAMARGLRGDRGWPEAAILDLGGVETARGPEAVMLLVPDIMKVSGFAPFAISVAR